MKGKIRLKVSQLGLELGNSFVGSFLFRFLFLLSSSSSDVFWIVKPSNLNRGVGIRYKYFNTR